MKYLTHSQIQSLRAFDTPEKIQDYLDRIPFNYEEGGETCMSPIRVLKVRKAHCMEGALLASACLSLQKRKPFILSLRVTPADVDHVIALYKERGYWGAISKTNHAVLGWRDPIYKTVRELALSYFHEYFLVKTGEKSLRGYSRAINMKSFGDGWIGAESELFFIAEKIYDSHHTPIIPKGNEKFLRKATKFERTRAYVSNEDYRNV